MKDFTKKLEVERFGNRPISKAAYSLRDLKEIKEASRPQLYINIHKDSELGSLPKSPAKVELTKRSNYWLNFYKPKGISSAKLVAIVKRSLSGVKVGHCGTLDVEAEGVLPLAIGEATKLVRILVDAKKTYIFTIQFGGQTNTADATGKIIVVTDNIPTKEQCHNICKKFIGIIRQRPPAFSAIKINGVRSYKLARENLTRELATRNISSLSKSAYAAGYERDLGSAATAIYKNIHEDSGLGSLSKSLAEIDLQKRSIRIYDLECLDYIKASNRATYRVECSKGTYVRSLAEDIALSLQSLGFVLELARTKVGLFTAEGAIRLTELESLRQEMTKDFLVKKAMKIEAVLDDILVLDATDDQAKKLFTVKNALLSIPKISN